MITPTLVTGWVFHPQALLSEVRLVSGSRLIATAPIDIDRPDVAAHVGQSGHFGFTLEIPDSRTDPEPGEDLRVLALSADATHRYMLTSPGASDTVELLRVALAPEHQGLLGHFDGLSPDGLELTGWCYSRIRGTATVWLRAEGLPPRPLRCTVDRPGLAAQGHVAESGFVLPLHEWPESAGRHVWASFDEAGQLHLPPMTPVRLPGPESVSEAALAPASAPRLPHWENRQ